MHGPADTAGATESSAYLGPGQVPRLFEWVVLSGMSVALCLVWLDLAHWLQSRQAGIDFASSRVAWGVYLAFQLANRLPVSFRYSPSGIWAAVDVVGFSAAFVAALLFGFDVQLHSPLRLVLAPLVVLWIATGIVYSIRLQQGSREHRVYCAIVAFALPVLPMLGAAVVLAVHAG